MDSSIEEEGARLSSDGEGDGEVDKEVGDTRASDGKEATEDEEEMEQGEDGEEEEEEGVVEPDQQCGDNDELNNKDGTDKTENNNGKEENEEDEEKEEEEEEPSAHTDTFMGALNLLPRKRAAQEMEEEDKEENNDNNSQREEASGESSAAKSSKSLLELFKEDPAKLLCLLGAAVTMESIHSLLKTEKSTLTEDYAELKQKLKKAHQTLSECSEQKDFILKQIEDVGEQIQVKRRQLEDTREELKQLSTQEAAVKTKRDAAYEKASEFRRKLHACRDLVQQIQQLYPATASESRDSVRTEGDSSNGGKVASTSA